MPERFNPADELSRRPDGGIRNPLAFNPFFGGHRVCLGKTFAEVVVRYTVPLLYHHFEFDFARDEDRASKPALNI